MEGERIIRNASITQFSLGTMRKRGANVLCIHVGLTHVDNGEHVFLDYPVDSPNLSFIYPIGKDLKDIFRKKVSVTYIDGDVEVIRPIQQEGH